jgi:hypothetical protein
MKGLVQEDAGVIARERPPGAVRAVQARSEADDEQLGAPGTEGRHRPGVIVRMLAPDVFEVCGEPWAIAAAGIERQ